MAVYGTAGKNGTKLSALLGLPGLAVVALVSAAAADEVKVTLIGAVTLSSDYFGTFGCAMNCSNVDNPHDGNNYTAEYTSNSEV